MIKKFCAALSAITCAALLGGCSLFEPEEAVNVYMPADIADIFQPITSSSSSSAIYYPEQYEPTVRPSSSSSSTVTPTVTPGEQEEPTAPIDNFYGKWCYAHLSDRLRAVYRRIYECAKNNSEEFDVSDLAVTQQDIYKAYWSFDYDNPQFLELGSGYEMTLVDPKVTDKVRSVKIIYGRTPAEIQQAQFEARAEAVLEAARALETDYEKLKYVHDWIVENTTYSKTGAAYESEADGPIVYGQALCEGYSKAFMYFAQSLGFPCICSVGSSHTEPHMWNMVKLGGRWYNVDVTWDDPVSADGSQTLRHDYFLLCDAELRYDHRVEHPLVLPDAPYGYFPHGYDQDAAESN